MIDADALDLGPLDIDEFSEFWQAYPRKKDRRRAEAGYRRARHVASADEILKAARAYAREVDGEPAERVRWAVEWLRAEPWRPEVPPVAPRPAPRKRRRRDPSRPRRSPHNTSRVRPTPEEQRDRWCREHGVTVAEYEARKTDAEWLEAIKRRVK